MKQLLSVFMVGALALSSCKKDSNLQQALCDEPQVNTSTCTNDSAAVRMQLTGRWDWTQSTGGWLPVIYTPCTDSVYRSYEFLNNGTVKYYENNAYISTGTYSLSRNSGLQLYASDSAIHFSLSGWVSICNNYLIVDAQPVDGAKVTLVRPL
ncbi:MAG TPA: hypothetical protein PLW44_04440 [Chitinophagales bacterium]|nr:hypothetical protein [Chitinophagales bacterium]